MENWLPGVPMWPRAHTLYIERSCPNNKQRVDGFNLFKGLNVNLTTFQHADRGEDSSEFVVEVRASLRKGKTYVVNGVLQKEKCEFKKCSCKKGYVDIFTC